MAVSRLYDPLAQSQVVAKQHSVARRNLRQARSPLAGRGATALLGTTKEASGETTGLGASMLPCVVSPCGYSTHCWEDKIDNKIKESSPLYYWRHFSLSETRKDDKVLKLSIRVSWIFLYLHVFYIMCIFILHILTR